MDPVVLAEVFVLVVALVMFGAAALASRGKQAENALERLHGKRANPLRDAMFRRRPSEGGRLQEALLKKVDLTRWLEQSMWQAGIHMRVSEMMLVMVLLFGTGEVIGVTIMERSTIGLGCGIAMAALPIVYVRFRRSRRLKQFGEQLPYVLDLLKSLLEAGHSLMRGLQVVVKEFRDPIAGEIATVLEEASLGLPLSRAFEEMLKRVPLDDLRLMVIAVKVQSEVGSSLAEIIGRLSEVIRTRQRLQHQMRALTAQSRMSGIIVGLLPILVLGAFSIIQPGYASQFFRDPAGIKMLKTAIMLDAMALFTIRRLLKVDY
jgi:tight adherence protein B